MILHWHLMSHRTYGMDDVPFFTGATMMGTTQLFHGWLFRVARPSVALKVIWSFLHGFRWAP